VNPHQLAKTYAHQLQLSADERLLAAALAIAVDGGYERIDIWTLHMPDIVIALEKSGMTVKVQQVVDDPFN
jgi:hypothetical protein